MLVAVSMFMLVLLAGATMASAHGGDPTLIHACVRERNQSVDIVGPNEECTSQERAVDWSIQGPAGVLGSFDQLAGLACTAPGGQAGSIEVTYRNGVARLRCLVAGTRFIDNGDGTVTDFQTGLMWEKKVTGAGCLHCVDDAYTWTAVTGGWVDRLNGKLAASPVEGGFAAYTDWRLPTIVELRTILSAEFPNCTTPPCIDPIFGPTAPAFYWSASTLVDFPTFAWGVEFLFGNASTFPKDFTLHVRAVRGGP